MIFGIPGVSSSVPPERRAWEPGDVLSIVGRAHEGRAIFATDEDRGCFTDRLRRVFVPGAADLLAWAVLLYHDRLVIRVAGRGAGNALPAPEHRGGAAGAAASAARARGRRFPGGLGRDVGDALTGNTRLR